MWWTLLISASLVIGLIVVILGGTIFLWATHDTDDDLRREWSRNDDEEP